MERLSKSQVPRHCFAQQHPAVLYQDQVSLDHKAVVSHILGASKSAATRKIEERTALLISTYY